MSRTLSNESSLVHLKREAKRWLRALRENDAAARARFDKATKSRGGTPTLRDVQHALAREHGFDGWASLSAAVVQIEQTRAERSRALVLNAELTVLQSLEGVPQVSAEIVSRFLTNACRDWRAGGGGGELRMALHTASRLLEQHPNIPRADIFTAVVSGDIEHVRHLLARDHALASTPGGPRNWPPLLYLASARLAHPEPIDHSVEIAHLLVDHGADPNAYYADTDGNRFTVITCALGRGELQITPHRRERELVALMLERGAEPYDLQMLYNVFADHGSRPHLTSAITWLLELVHAHSLRLGRGDDWKDPAWNMLSVGGYGPGAYYLLNAAIGAQQPALVEWLLQHGAGPNTRASNPRFAQYSLFEQAFRRGDRPIVEFLRQYGADTVVAASSGAYEEFVHATLDHNFARARTLYERNSAWRQIPHALIAATRRDNADAVRFLLDLGIAPDIEENRSRARALHAAAFAGATRAATVLLEAGADPDFRELNYGATPMSTAIWAQRPGMTDVLAPYSRDLFSLVFAGKVARVRDILRDDPTLAQSIHANGDSLLMRMPDDEDAAVALTELLLANGADPSHRDAQGSTPRDVAARRALLRVVAILDE